MSNKLFCERKEAGDVIDIYITYQMILKEKKTNLETLQTMEG